MVSRRTYFSVVSNAVYVVSKNVIRAEIMEIQMLRISGFRSRSHHPGCLYDVVLPTVYSTSG